MDVQNIIVGLVILLAVIYVGGIVLRKVKSFSGKSASCASDCGCGDSKSNPKSSFVKVQKF